MNLIEIDNYCNSLSSEENIGESDEFWLGLILENFGPQGRYRNEDYKEEYLRLRTILFHEFYPGSERHKDILSHYELTKILYSYKIFNVAYLVTLIIGQYSISIVKYHGRLPVPISTMIHYTAKKAHNGILKELLIYNQNNILSMHNVIDSAIEGENYESIDLFYNFLRRYRILTPELINLLTYFAFKSANVEKLKRFQDLGGEIGPGDILSITPKDEDIDFITYILDYLASYIEYEDIIDDMFIISLTSHAFKIADFLIDRGARKYNSALRRVFHDRPDIIFSDEAKPIINYLVDVGADNFKESILNILVYTEVPTETLFTLIDRAHVELFDDVFLDELRNDENVKNDPIKKRILFTAIQSKNEKK